MTKEEQHIAEHIILEKAGALSDHGHAGGQDNSKSKNKKVNPLRNWGAFFFNLILLMLIALGVWYFFLLLKA